MPNSKRTTSEKVAEVRASWVAEDALTLEELSVCKKLRVSAEEFLLQRELDERRQKQRLAGEADSIKGVIRQSAVYMKQGWEQEERNREFAKAKAEGRTLVQRG